MEDKIKELLKRYWEYNSLYSYADHDRQIEWDLQVSPENARNFSAKDIQDIIKESFEAGKTFGSQLTAERAKEKVKLLDYNIGSHLRGDLLKAIKESII